MKNAVLKVVAFCLGLNVPDQKTPCYRLVTLENIHRQVSNIRRTLRGNIKLSLTQMQPEHRLSALLQLHLHSQLNTWLQ